MDEGSLPDYLGVLTQIQSLLDSGLTEDEINALFPDIDVSGQMEQIASLTQFIQDHKDTLSGLNTMFSDAVHDEVLQIANDLDMTGAQAWWDEFASNPGAITANAVIKQQHCSRRLRPDCLQRVCAEQPGHRDRRGADRRGI
jgi:hypothetical protein